MIFEKKNGVAALAVSLCLLAFVACGESKTDNGGGEEPTTEEQIPTSGCDVYLFLGQSNMSGFGGENFVPQRLL